MRPEPRASYAVTARPEHVEAMAAAVSSPRWFGPLPWFLVLAGTWMGVVLTRRVLPDPLRERPVIGWAVVLLGGALVAWVSVLLGRWAIERKMRDLLLTRGWAPDTERVAEYGCDDAGNAWMRLLGGDTEVLVEASEIRRVHEREGAVMLLTHGGPPVLTVAELCPPRELERLRAGLSAR